MGREEIVGKLRRALGVLGPWRSEAPGAGGAGTLTGGTEIRLEPMPPESPHQTLRRVLHEQGQLREGLSTEMPVEQFEKDWVNSPYEKPCEWHFQLQVNTLTFLRDLVLTWDGFERCSVKRIRVAGEAYEFKAPIEGDWKQTVTFEGGPVLVPGQTLVVIVSGVDTAKVSLRLGYDAMRIQAFVQLVCQVTLAMFEPLPPTYRGVPVPPTPPASGS